MCNLVFAITGASGIRLGVNCLNVLLTIKDLNVHLIISENARLVMQTEGFAFKPANVHLYEETDLAAPPASGSWLNSGMIICPCSANTLGAIAASLAGNLIQRSALVALKERYPLILCLRETPFSLPMIKAMATVTESGAIVMPFIPAFYASKTIEDAMRQFTGHILDLLRIPNDLRKRWPECVKKY